jgi:hypothetical protein
MRDAERQEIESVIVRGLEQQGPCTMDDLLRRHAGYSWTQVFSAVDRLSRRGYLRLQYHGSCRYTVSVAPGFGQVLSQGLECSNQAGAGVATDGDRAVRGPPA